MSKKVQKKAVKKTVKAKSVKKIASKKTVQQKKSVPKKNEKAPAKYTVPQTLRGMKDILPKEQKYYSRMMKAAEGIAKAYGCEKIDTPILEEASLFIRSIGKGTDVVDKEMYTLTDRDGSLLALRPENTAAIVRAYINHGMHTQAQPVKLWYWAPMFRHDRPQAGRFRQFHQFGAEVLGERTAVTDAELIVMAYNFLRDLGIESRVSINSIGTPEDRARYTVELSGYFRSKRSYLSEDSKKRLQKNPLRILDSKAPEDQPIIEEAPQILDWLSEDAKKFFMNVLEYLDVSGVPYTLNPRLVRGLDYYTDTVFELYEDGVEEKAQGALCGGGRYDLLVSDMGGRTTPASGFGLGVERVVGILKAREASGRGVTEKSVTNVYLAQLGEQARRVALRLIEDLRREGYIVHHNLGKAALKPQLEQAHKLAVSHTFILGQKEMQDGTIILRDMESGNQEIIDQKKMKQEIIRILELGRKKQ